MQLLDHSYDHPSSGFSRLILILILWFFGSCSIVPRRRWKIYTVKPLYSGHLRFLKKVSAIMKCPLYTVLDFLEGKSILDKNLTIFYVNCDSLQLHFIWIVLCLTFCNLSVSTFPITFTFICLSPLISAKHFTLNFRQLILGCSFA